MSTEIYLRIVKDVDPSDDPTSATLIAKLMSPIPLPGVICGDSLDMPFIKWIKLTGFKNSIGFGGTATAYGVVNGEIQEKKFGEGGPSYKEARQLRGAETQTYDADVRDDGSFDLIETTRQTTRFGQRVATVRRTWESGGRESAEAKKTDKHHNRRGWKRPKLRLSEFNKNLYLKINLPDHGDVTFTKQVDNSTPQLAYACSCQESIGTVMVLFRRRIGLGVRGIRVPFMAIMMSKCLVTAWELDGEEETVSMSYQEIRWCTYDQMADFNIATGMSARKWDTADGKGGESLTMYAILGGIAAAAMAGALTDTIASAATADSVSGTGSTDRGDVDMIE